MIGSNLNLSKTNREEHRTAHTGQHTGGDIMIARRGSGNACTIHVLLFGPKFDHCTRPIRFRGEWEALDVGSALVEYGAGEGEVFHSVHTGDKTGGRVEVVRKATGNADEISVALSEPHFDGCTLEIHLPNKRQALDIGHAILRHFGCGHE